MLELLLLGPPELLDADGNALPTVLAQPKRFALLAYLAAARPLGFHPRDSLLALFWPEFDGPHARGALSSAVYFLRRALGRDVIVSRGGSIAVDPQCLRCDAVSFRNAVSDGARKAALEAFRGGLLPGFFITGAPEFQRWLDLEREALRREASGAAWALAEELENAGDGAGARHWGERALRLSPYDENVLRRQLALLVRLDDWAAAIRAFNAFSRRLRRELGVDPSPATCAMVAAIRAPPSPEAPPPASLMAGVVRTSSNGSLSVPTEPVVAVVPFRAIGPGDDAGWLAEGLTEDIINQLAKFEGLRVISRASAMRLRRHDGETPRDLARQLGATLVLTGSVRETDGRMRVSARLIDPRADQHLWAETYDRQGEDDLELEVEIAREIAQTLGARITPDQRSRIGTLATTNPSAQRLYVRGHAQMLRFTEAGFRNAIELFEQAVAADPGFARPYADAALSWAVLGMGHGAGALRPSLGYERGRAAVEKALRLDLSLGAAHAVLGLLRFEYEFDWTGAETECRDAIRLAPGDSLAHNIYGQLLSSLRRFGEAISEQSLAYQLDPLTPVAASDLATTLLRAGRQDEALPVAERLIGLDPEFPMAHSTRAWALLKRGAVAEGLAELERAVELSPGNTLFLAQLGEACAMVGDERRARDILARLEALRCERYVSPYHLAYVHTGLGQSEEAITQLERALAERSGGIYGLAGSFLFEELRTEPAFQEILARMNLPTA
jgi:TolB-like protein/Tfp pilus assembly protein PilF